jgi:hypothetical protein
MNAYHGAPMTLGNAAAARVRQIVWCLLRETAMRLSNGSVASAAALACALACTPAGAQGLAQSRTEAFHGVCGTPNYPSAGHGYEDVAWFTNPWLATPITITAAAASVTIEAGAPGSAWLAQSFIGNSATPDAMTPITANYAALIPVANGLYMAGFNVRSAGGGPQMTFPAGVPGAAPDPWGPHLARISHNG